MFRTRCVWVSFQESERFVCTSQLNAAPLLQLHPTHKFYVPTGHCVLCVKLSIFQSARVRNFIFASDSVRRFQFIIFRWAMSVVLRKLAQAAVKVAKECAWIWAAGRVSESHSSHSARLGLMALTLPGFVCFRLKYLPLCVRAQLSCDTRPAVVHNFRYYVPCVHMHVTWNVRAILMGYLKSTRGTSQRKAIEVPPTPRGFWWHLGF